MSFVYTTAIRKLRTLKKRTKVVPGGQSAGKTYGIIPIEIDYAARNPRTQTSIVAETIPHLRRGAMKDFIEIMQNTGRWQTDHWNKTLLTYTFSNGSYIEFFSADMEDKVRGPRRKRLYVNEGNLLSFETYHHLATRTSESITVDFNPTARFWAHDELDPSTDEDVEWLTLTYKDNEALDAALVKEMEKAKGKAFFNPDLPDDKLFDKTNIKSEYWSNYWAVYGLGQLGVLQGAVFTNWKQVDYMPTYAKLLGYGLDFGYTNDPTALIGIYEADGQIYLDEIIYQKGLSNSELAAMMKSLGVKSTGVIYADSADPKSIAELRTYGFQVMPAKKGSDSVVFGIQIMQDLFFNVTKRSTNLIKELRNYVWLTDRDGKATNVPIDAWNHAIDSVRYYYQSKGQNTGQYAIR